VSDKSEKNRYGYDEEEFQSIVDDALKQGRARREAKRLLDEEENPLADIPPLTDLATRLKRERKPRAYRINQWFPEGARIVIAAQAKGGKTHAMHNLVRSILDGDRWLGRWKAHPIQGTVAILDLELGEDLAESWLERQGISDDNLGRIHLCDLRGAASSFNILDLNRRLEWAEKLAELGVDFLILDCLRPLMDALGLDEHREAGKLLNAFDELMRKAGVAEGAIVHHMGHSGQRGRGDSRILDWPDVSWWITLDNDFTDSSSQRFIRAYGRDVDVHEHMILYDEETGHMTAKEGKKDDADVATALAAIVGVLSTEGEPLTGRKIEHALKESDHSRQNIRKALRVGARRGDVEKREGSLHSVYYSIPSGWARRAGGGQGHDDWHE